jgi:hypothetical protein
MEKEFRENKQEISQRIGSHYIRTSCNVISHCDKICQVLVRDYSFEILWDYVKGCVLIQDSTNWYHITHTSITHLTIRDVIIGLGYKYMETLWSYNGEDVLDILAHQAPLSVVYIHTLDDLDTCEKL